MSFIILLKIVVALATVAFGAAAAYNPERTASAAFIHVDTNRAIAEIRASWGGMYLGLGLGAIIVGLWQPAVFMVLGIAYLVTAAMRGFTWYRDRELIHPNLYIIMGFEIVSGIILLIPPFV